MRKHGKYDEVIMNMFCLPFFFFLLDDEPIETVLDFGLPLEVLPYDPPMVAIPDTAVAVPDSSNSSSRSATVLQNESTGSSEPVSLEIIMTLRFLCLNIRPNKIKCLFPVTCSQNLGTDGRKKILFCQKIFSIQFNPHSRHVVDLDFSINKQENNFKSKHSF